MTKNKTRKMTKSTFAVIIMGICLVALLAFGGTYAWFTATSADLVTGSITTGTVLLNGSTVTLTETGVLPGDTISAAIQVEDKSDVDTWIVLQVSTTGNATLLSKLSYTGNTFGSEVAAANAATGATGTTVVYFVKEASTEDTNRTHVFATAIEVSSDWNADSSNNDAHDDMGVNATLTIKCRSIQKSAATTAADAAALLFPKA